MKTPYDFFRPRKVSDGRGGSTEVLGEPTTLWGAVTVFEETTRMHVDIREDVKVNDVVEIEEED